MAEPARSRSGRSESSSPGLVSVPSSSADADTKADTAIDGDIDSLTDRFFNRELSWLDFNERVLALAADPALPLVERFRFCAIWSSNLDEFFQVRVAGLKDEQVDGAGRTSPDGLTTGEQLAAIHTKVEKQYSAVRKVFKQLRKSLRKEGRKIVHWDDLDPDQQTDLTAEFQQSVFPVLTPLAVDPGHPFPYISNLSLSLAVLLVQPSSGLRRFARVKLPVALLGRYLMVDDGATLVPVEQVVEANLAELFPGHDVIEFGLFRVTRDADLSFDRSSEDLLSAVESELRRRRFGDIVRLEVERGMSAEVTALLMDELDLGPGDIYEIPGLLDLGSAAAIEVPDRPDLHFDRWEPVVPTMLGDSDGPKNLFSLLSQRDVLVHHPYVSFDQSVLELIRQSSVDPSVQAIKLTLYRTSGDGRIVESLIRAAENGKQVVVVVELKARFDEENNIEWARRLERAGVHVTYGLVGLKVHSKVLLVVRHEGDRLRRYCHIGTGNYNSKTARVYADFGLLTSDDVIGDDLSHLFNSLTGYGMNHDFKKLLVAPHQLRTRFNELVQNEARFGPNGRIIAKMNSLVDTDVVDELYLASGAGVTIDLIVRGICVLRPGVPGMSDTIGVRSLLGRFLEHARVYFFANGSGEGRPLFLIGSADMMPRNLNRRVEVLVPVEAPHAQAEIAAALDVNLRDTKLAWDLGPDGKWHRADADDPDAVDSHLHLQTQAY